jgi:hypothetical protein
VIVVVFPSGHVHWPASLQTWANAPLVADAPDELDVADPPMTPPGLNTLPAEVPV